MNNSSDTTFSTSPSLVEVMRQIRRAPGRWQPEVRSETLGLIAPLSFTENSKGIILQEAVNILARCVPPMQPIGQETGLVVGYVQSGKTMSFTTVATLARDNYYRLVILIAGTSQYLTEQSRQRLIRDLRLNSITERRPWRHIPDPCLAQNSHGIIRDILDEWNDPAVPRGELRSVLITVMKHHGHLQNLIDVLRNVDLRNAPTLVIDDEGDQAGLNTRVRQGDQSTTYRRILFLKAILPHHSYLLYTATPQAPLLINIVDLLSPSFAEVITAGPEYVGGRDFFCDEPNLIRLIPASEIPTQNNLMANPPPTLLQSMRLFFLGAAAHLVTSNNPPHRSMMVHPSRLTDRHGRYFHWVMQACEGWKRILEQPRDDPDQRDLLGLFHHDYEDLRTTEANIPQFDVLMPRVLHALRRTTCRPLNSRPEGRSPVDWSENPYWILVGGQSMDRGFTLEGLTVTYMPRGRGVGNADAIQQRARFFGYKRSYCGYCRIFLEQDVRDAFADYVEHEEDVRTQLLEHRETGQSMTEWRRQFFLNRNLRPTRNSIIDIDYSRVILGNEWVYPDGPHDTEESIQANRVVLQQFLAGLNFSVNEGLDRRKGEHKNLIARGIPLCRAHEDLLTRISIRRLEDSRLFWALLRLIQVHLIQSPNDTCTVYLMAGGNRIRRGYENDRIKELFQGRQYDKQGETYPGDRQVRADEGISLQIRYLNLGELGQQPIAENIPHVAVWIPASIARDIVQQPQGD